MNSNKLSSLLGTLNQHERKLLIFYTEDQKDLSRIVQYLFHNEYTNGKDLYKAVFNGKTHNEKQLRNAFYTLNKYVERIIALRYVEEDAAVNNYILMRHCAQYNLSKEYNGYLQKLKQKTALPESSNLLFSYLSQKVHLEYLEEKKRQFIQEELIKKDQLLDAYYFKEKLWNLFEMDVYKNIYHFEYTPNLSEHIQRIDISSFHFAKSSLQFLKLLLMMMEQFEDDNHFQKALKLLEETYENIPAKDLRLYYIAVINYAIKKFNTGKKEYLKELFRIYTLQIKHDVLLNEKNYLEPYAYKNITTIALQNKEFVWVKNFMEEYSNFLPKEEKENAYQYNLANYYYFTGNYKQCLRLLQTVQFTDVYYNIDARSIILKIYFEEKEWNLLHDHSFAFRAFILRQKEISEHHKKGYLNLIKWTNKLSSAVFDTKKKKWINDKISAEKNIRELKWLMEQIEKAI
jgi:hypothetical protein